MERNTAAAVYVTDDTRGKFKRVKRFCKRTELAEDDADDARADALCAVGKRIYQALRSMEEKRRAFAASAVRATR